MSETALARPERDRIIADALAEARKQAAALMKSPTCQDSQHDDCIGVTPQEDFPDCLCDCHDPAWTYWVEWSTYNGELTPGSLVSGHYGTVNEAIDDGFAAKPAEAAWIRANHEVIEQVTEERWDDLMAWDEKTDAEKDELRAAINRGGDDA